MLEKIEVLVPRTDWTYLHLHSVRYKLSMANTSPAHLTGMMTLITHLNLSQKVKT